MNTDRVDALLGDITKRLESTPDVRALVLAGSRVKDSAYASSVHSDAEAYIVVRDGTKEKTERMLQVLLADTGDVLLIYRNAWAGTSALYSDLFRLELPVITESDMKSVFSRPKAQAVEILLDRTDGKLQKILDSRPISVDFKKDYIRTTEDAWYMLVVACQYYAKGEYWNARHAMEAVLIPRLIRLMQTESHPEALNLEPHKRLEQYLTGKQLEILRTLSVGYDKAAIRRSLLEYLRLLPGISRKAAAATGSRYDGSLPRELSEKLRILLGSYCTQHSPVDESV